MNCDTCHRDQPSIGVAIAGLVFRLLFCGVAYLIAHNHGATDVFWMIFLIVSALDGPNSCHVRRTR